MAVSVRRAGRRRLKRGECVRKDGVFLIDGAFGTVNGGVFLNAVVRDSFRAVAAMQSGVPMAGVMMCVRPGHGPMTAAVGRGAFMPGCVIVMGVCMAMAVMGLEAALAAMSVGSPVTGVTGVIAMRMPRLLMPPMRGGTAVAVRMGGRDGAANAVIPMRIAVPRGVRAFEAARERIVAIRTVAVAPVSPVVISAGGAMVVRLARFEDVRIVLETCFAERQEILHAVRDRKGGETGRRRIVRRLRFGGRAGAEDRGGETEDDGAAFGKAPAVSAAQRGQIKARPVFQRPDGAA